MAILKHDFEIKEKLPKEFKDKWVKALRSGTYEQGRTYLHKGQKYCCLGVACVMMGYTRKDLGSSLYIIKSPDYEENKINRDFRKIPKMIKGNSNKNIIDFLSDSNDEGKSFKDIANWIEKYL